MSDEKFPTQDELLSAAGIDTTPGPRADFIARKISNDNEVQIIADKLMRQHFLAAAVETMTPEQRARLVKRTQPEPLKPQPKPGAGVRWAVFQSERNQIWTIGAYGPPRDFGGGKMGNSGQELFFGTLEQLERWAPLGAKVPVEIKEQYKSVYQMPTQSRQGSIYARLMQQPAPDNTKMPGPNYDPNRGPDRAHTMVAVDD